MKRYRMSLKLKRDGSMVECGRSYGERGVWRRAIGLPLIVIVGLSGCEVTNPGPIQEQFLGDPIAHPALVDGSRVRLSLAVSALAFLGGQGAAREIMTTGQTGGGGYNPTLQSGYFRPQDASLNPHWNFAHQGRWIAENTVERLSGLANVDPDVTAQAHLWAGYSNRVLGENMCDAVFDGGPIEPNIRYFERAEAHFSAAIAGGTSATRLAAHAGRAQVRLWLQDWTGAATDAAQVPTDFELGLPKVLEGASNVRTGGQDPYWANANAPYRGYTVWGTFHETYYVETGDPRAAWDTDPAFPLGQNRLVGYGAVPWSFVTSLNASSPNRMASGAEMELIRAEVLLVEGQWQAAMNLINGVRTRLISDSTGAPLEPWAAGSAEEAWKFLKRERFIELWLQARRLGDIRRWEDNGTPGELDFPNFEAISSLFAENPRSRCFPIPPAERDTNPNIPAL